MRKLYDILNILATRGFTNDEIRKFKVHQLHDNKKYKQCMELHIGGMTSDWLLIYHIEQNSVKFEDILIELEDTGTHSELFSSENGYDELVWL